jgi:hypothetical protein
MATICFVGVKMLLETCDLTVTLRAIVWTQERTVHCTETECERLFNNTSLVVMKTIIVSRANACTHVAQSEEQLSR